MTWELLLGRSLAFCLHPSAAWPVLPQSGRVLMLAAYFGAAYVGVLLTLLVA